MKDKRQIYFRLKKLAAYSGLRHIKRNEDNKGTKEPSSILLEDLLVRIVELYVRGVKVSPEAVVSVSYATLSHVRVRVTGSPSNVVVSS